MTLITAVLPTRNGGNYLSHTIAQLVELKLDIDLEIIVVENGSTDSTWQKLNDIKENWDSATQLHIAQSSPGLGNAYSKGVELSQGDLVYLTADDLPFGTDDLTQALELAPTTEVIIGSKAHGQSKIDRGLLRGALSQSFRLTRAIILGSSVGDSQGTFVVDGTWLRDFASKSHEQGFLWTTELVDCAEQDNRTIVEIPITFYPRVEDTGSRVKIADVVNMLTGTFRIRSRRTK